MRTRPIYHPPTDVRRIPIRQLIDGVRSIEARLETRLALPGLEGVQSAEGPVLFVSGDVSLLNRRCVAIVGSRKVSDDGAKRARRVARELAERGAVVVSGLAQGVDYFAHTSAISHGGYTVAVIGTPIDKVYPAAHKQLQEEIYRSHLLVSPFPTGAAVFPSNFPQRNKVMAAITDATIIIEASDTSGTIHQAAECVRLGRWLFIAKSVVDDPRVSWPASFLSSPRTRVLQSVDDVMEAIIL